ALRMLIENEGIKNGIVFCNRKSEVDIVAKSLRTHGFDAAAIHGDLDQQTRMRTLDAFRSGDLKLLCASDVAARGLDIPDVSHVFNYDVPHHADDYVHRIGRTGRAGKSGRAFMIVTPADAKNIDKVLRLIGKDPEEVVLEGVDFAAIKDTPRDDRKSPRGRAAPRGRSRDGHDRPPRARREEASEIPVAPVATAPAEAASAEPDRAPAPKAEPRVADAAPAQRSAAPRGERRERPSAPKSRPREEADDGRLAEKPVVGFGSELPAFLARPTTSERK
ncbi:MAG: DEAD/DEAH box helicase, partial [Phenylobacterium sp.]|nr:DEAD/DEAH box helicase [Phenylobacterium sp.]